MQQSPNAHFAISLFPICEHLTLARPQPYFEISNDPRQFSYKKVRITVVKSLCGGFKAQNSAFIDT